LNKGAEKELTLEEIDQFTKKLGDLHTVTIGGGEPFMRKDLPEIIKCFSKNNNLKVVAIPTNCLLTDNIVQQTEKILQLFKGSLKIGLSLDGIGKEHDEIRGIDGNFDKFLATYQALSELKKRYPNLRIRICTTVFDKNVE
jgi:MoaA/NifB/PqqE/SkfB family radical SAM enzyme